MKDEIERILATSGKYITYAERCYVLYYITNLQEENERLNKDLQTAIDICNNRQKEIVRLNNIINELEKWIKDYLDKPSNDEFDYAIDDTLQMVLDELEELKEKSDKE